MIPAFLITGRKKGVKEPHAFTPEKEQTTPEVVFAPERNILPKNLLFIGDRLHSQHEVKNMRQPDDNKDNAGNPDAFSGHHEKAESHQQRHGTDDGNLCRPQHAAVFYKRIKVLLIKLCPEKRITVRIFSRISGL